MIPPHLEPIVYPALPLTRKNLLAVEAFRHLNALAYWPFLTGGFSWAETPGSVSAEHRLVPAIDGPTALWVSAVSPSNLTGAVLKASRTKPGAIRRSTLVWLDRNETQLRRRAGEWGFLSAAAATNAAEALRHYWLYQWEAIPPLRQTNIAQAVAQILSHGTIPHTPSCL